MGYAVALTSSGQMTLPKSLRVFLGVDGAKTVHLIKRGDEVVIQKKMSKEELFGFFDANISERTRKIIESDREKGITTVRQIKKELARDGTVRQAKLGGEHAS